MFLSDISLLLYKKDELLQNIISQSGLCEHLILFKLKIQIVVLSVKMADTSLRLWYYVELFVLLNIAEDLW